MNASIHTFVPRPAARDHRCARLSAWDEGFRKMGLGRGMLRDALPKPIFRVFSQLWVGGYEYSQSLLARFP